MPKQQGELRDDVFQLGFRPRVQSIIHRGLLCFASHKLAMFHKLKEIMLCLALVAKNKLGKILGIIIEKKNAYSVLIKTKQV